MAGPSDIPLGICTKCKSMALISQDGIKICPSCDTRSTTKSGLVNKFKDPGKSMDAHGNIVGRAVGGIVQNDSKEIVIGQASVIHGVKQTADIPSEPVDEMSTCIDKIDSLLSNMRLSDFTDLREARKVMKYKKKLAILKIELQDLIG